MTEKKAGALIRQINIALEKKANREFAKEDLTFSQLGLLMALRDADGNTLSFKELERKLGLAQSTTVGLIARLEKKKMIATHSDAHDARIKYAVLSEEGKSCCDKAEHAMAKQEEILLNGLDDKEREQLIKYLGRMNNNVRG